MVDKLLAPIHIDMASMDGGALPREWEDFFDALARITNSTGGGLTANRLVGTDADNIFSSVTDFTDYIAGTTGQITVTDDGDGTVTLSFSGGTIVNTTRVTIGNIHGTVHRHGNLFRYGYQRDYGISTGRGGGNQL